MGIATPSPMPVLWSASRSIRTSSSRFASIWGSTLARALAISTSTSRFVRTPRFRISASRTRISMIFMAGSLIWGGP